MCNQFRGDELKSDADESIKQPKLFLLHNLVGLTVNECIEDDRKEPRCVLINDTAQ